MWNLMKPDSFSGTGTFKGGTVEPLYGTLGNLNLEKDLGTYKSQTCIWNLGEPELLRVDPVCGTLGNLHLCKNL